MAGSALHDATAPIAGRPVPIAPNADVPSADVTPDGMRRWSYRVMGATLEVVAPDSATEAGPLVKALFDDWDLRFSRFRADSELSRVNAAAGRTVAVSDVFIEVIRAAVAAAHATDGLFDPTVGARMIALGYDRTFVELPADSATGRALAPWTAGAWRSIEIDPLASTVRVPSGTSLDFGGIAKGMAVDAALDLLADQGIGPTAVDAGGDLAVRGTPPSLDAWPIALVEADDVPAVRIADGALATSSTTRRRWRVSGEDRHHLLDPRTGLPAASGLRSVTVLATSCRVAEVAAKTALLLGREDGERFLATHGLSGVLVTDAGSALPVGRWRTDDGARRDGASGVSPAEIQGLTWDIARIGGFTAYGLMLASVVIGLVLSLRWKSVRYPRFVTNELHRFVTLLALVFTVVHGIAVAVDPFIKLSLPELLVPFLSHYRPVWMAFGIVAGDLLLAIYLSERIRSRIGYDWWRRFHTLAFVVYLFVTIHGLGTGSDARTPWAIAIYVGGAIVVGSLLAWRLWPTGAVGRLRPALLVGAAVSVLGDRRLGRDRAARPGLGRGGRFGRHSVAAPPSPSPGPLPHRPRSGSSCRSRPPSTDRPARPRRTAARWSSTRS